MRFVVAALAVVWVAALAAGQLWLLRYQFTPERSGSTPAAWPRGSTIKPIEGHFTLLLFVHPLCPCTRATLEELRRTEARWAGKADVYVLLVLPPGAPAGWARATATVPTGAKQLTDVDGRQARCFGAKTSGLVLLYDPEGRLTFRGGITAGRGHQGDNPGLSALLARLTGEESGYQQYAVFGCPLLTETSTQEEGGQS